jgi:teichoic acid transport system permease protein
MIRAIGRGVRSAFGALATIVREHWDYRRQIISLATVDVIKTYRGSALGWTWAIIKPSVTIFVYWFAFDIGLRHGRDISGYPYFLWLIAGIIPWFYISEMLTQGSSTLNRYNYLVTKIKFPVSTISTFVSLSKLYVHLGLLTIVVAIFALWGHPPDIYYLQLPFYVAMLFVFFTLWSLFASPLSAISKDFANTVTSFVTAIFWMSGVMWDVNKVDIPWVRRVLLFNPVTFVATGYRNVFIYKKWFFEDRFALAAFLLVLVVMALMSVRTYWRLRREISDVL